MTAGSKARFAEWGSRFTVLFGQLAVVTLIASAMGWVSSSIELTTSRILYCMAAVAALGAGYEVFVRKPPTP